ncbi:MAG: alkaline phosphatase D family protein [Myxococcota bacterium]
MKRRSFFALGSLVFTNLLGSSGCRGDGGGGSGGSTGSVDDTGSEGSGTSGEAAYEVVDGPEFFPQSVASGDPRASSVVLWGRVADPDLPDEDYEVALEIWETEGEDAAAMPTVVTVTSELTFDHCVKIKAEGLQPGTEYSYRFIYIQGETGYASRTAVTKTAPDDGADVPVRFAFVSCQDYGGRYYNTYAAMLQQPLDFFVHLGDYIYETAGDETFQKGESDRFIEFDDEEGALMVDNGGTPFFAARSLDNYRQLYRTVRTDAALQAVHERMAMVAIWDDHEFSDDSHGSTGTYYDGQQDEFDPERKAAADQAWFEYMPVDYPDPDFVYDPSVAPPDDIRIYRDIEYGQHVHLVMTDLRSYRPDHLVPEDAYPGAVVVDSAGLAEVADDDSLGVPYVDVNNHADGVYRTMLRDIAAAEDYDPERIEGNVSALYINEMIEESGSMLPPIPKEELAMLPRGIAFHQMFKSGLYGNLGARYLVIQPPFLAYANWLDAQGDPAAQAVMGLEQQQWFLDTMQGSTRTWKIWGNEFCLTPLDIDLTGSFLPESFRHQFQMTAEDWNGFPNNRALLIDALASVDNVVAVTGDIHSFYACTPFAWPREIDGNRIVEFVTGSVSSTPYQSLLVRQVENTPSLASVPGIDAFALGISDLLQAGANPQMGFADTGQHGFCVVEASGEQLVVEMHLADESVVESERYDDPNVASAFSTERFRVLPRSRDMYRDFDGTWRVWDAETRAWVE